MKTRLLLNRINSRMLLICILALPLGFTACKKDGINMESSVTAQEAGAVMVQAVDPQSGGIVLQTQASAQLALDSSSSFLCGLRQDTTVTGSLNGGSRSFSYSLSLSRTFNCTDGIPVSYSHNFIGSSNYSVPALSSTGNVAGSFTITGLDPGASQLSINQNYTNTSTHQSNAGQERSFISNVTIQSTGINVSKSSRQITSGTAKVSVTGADSDGRIFGYNGTLTFLGDKKATLAVNGGSTINLEW